MVLIDSRINSFEKRLCIKLGNFVRQLFSAFKPSSLEIFVQRLTKSKDT